MDPMGIIILVVQSCSPWVPTASTAQETAGPRRELRSALLGAKNMDEGTRGISGQEGWIKKNGWLKQQNPQKMVMSSTKIVILSMLNPILIHLNPPKMVMSSFVYCFTTKMVHIEGPTMTMVIQKKWWCHHVSLFHHKHGAYTNNDNGYL